MKLIVAVVLVSFASAAHAASPVSQECETAFQTEKKSMDSCVERKCQKFAATNMDAFQSCFDKCAAAQSARYAACYKKMIDDLNKKDF